MTLHYRSYTGKYEYDDVGHCYFGRVELERDVVTFQADSEDNVEQEFHRSLNSYIEFCEEIGVEPETPQGEG